MCVPQTPYILDIFARILSIVVEMGYQYWAAKDHD